MLYYTATFIHAHTHTNYIFTDHKMSLSISLFVEMSELIIFIASSKQDVCESLMRAQWPNIPVKLHTTARGE